MTKFTPGPWKRGGMMNAPGCILASDNKTVIATVLSFSHGGRYGKGDATGQTIHEQAVADRRLMASAPDLLLALQTVEEILDQYTDQATPLKIIRRAIKLAIGKDESEPAKPVKRKLKPRADPEPSATREQNYQAYAVMILKDYDSLNIDELRTQISRRCGILLPGNTVKSVALALVDQGRVKLKMRGHSYRFSLVD